MMVVKEWERKRGRGGRKDEEQNRAVLDEGWVKEVVIK